MVEELAKEERGKDDEEGEDDKEEAAVANAWVLSYISLFSFGGEIVFELKSLIIFKIATFFTIRFFLLGETHPFCKYSFISREKFDVGFYV